MSYVEKMLMFNKEFVNEKRYESFAPDTSPGKNIVVISFMDTRLIDLLYAALNFKDGKIADIIEATGAEIKESYGNVMRRLIVTMYASDIEDILVIGHPDCGTQDTKPFDITEKMRERGVPRDKIDSLNKSDMNIEKWFAYSGSAKSSITDAVKTIKAHPLVPVDVSVTGLTMNPETGSIRIVSE